MNYIYQAEFIGVIDGFTKEQVEKVLLNKFDPVRVRDIFNGKNTTIHQSKNKATIENLIHSLKVKGLSIKSVEIEEKRKDSKASRLAEEVNKESLIESIKSLFSKVKSTVVAIAVIDIVFILSIFLSSKVGFLIYAFLLGFFTIIYLLIRISNEVKKQTMALPLSWVLPVVFLPFTTLTALLSKRLWQSEKAVINKRYKIGLSGILVVILLLGWSSMLDDILKNNLLASLDANAQTYLNETVLKASTVYALSRVTNALISVAQELTVSVVIVDIAVGQALDPVNDLVERFSSVLLLAIGALGLQQILFSVGSWLGLTVLLPIAITFLLIALWIKSEGTKNKVLSLGIRLIALSIIIRLAIPIIALSSSIVSKSILQEQYDEHSAQLDKSNKELTASIGDINSVLTSSIEEDSVTVEQVVVDKEKSSDWTSVAGLAQKVTNLKSNISQGVTSLKDKVDPTKVKRRIDEYMDKLQDKTNVYADSIYKFISLFIFEAIILPLLTLFGFIRLINFLFGLELDIDKIKKSIQS